MKKPEILVLGALGNVGREVANALITDHNAIRVADIFPEKLAAAYGDKVDVAYFDFSKPETFTGTFNGIKKMFLMRPPHISKIQRDMVPALNAAQAAGVEQVVFLSLIGIEKVKFVPHYAVETYLRESTMDWTFLRCSFFMQNLNTAHLVEIRDRDEIFIPVGDAKTSFIDVRDIGAMAGRILTSSGHANTAYQLTGSESLDYYQAARILSDELGREITFANPSPPRFFFGNLRRKAPFMFTLVQTFLYLSTRSGMADVVTNRVKELLGREPISLKQYVKDYRASWEVN